MAGRSRELTPEEQRKYDEFLDEMRMAPLDYVRHDANARCDESLRRATAKVGMSFLGSWWVLVELLSGKKGHAYDVSDECGWSLLAYDMSTCGWPWSVDDCKRLCDVLAEHDLIDAEMYARGKVLNNRVCREVEKYATATAGKRLGSWKTNRD